MSENDSDSNAVVEEKQRPYKKTSPIWKCFDPIDDGLASCNICGHKLSYRGSSTNLKKHLKRKHPEIEIPLITISRANRKTNRNDGERNEIRQATNSVMVDYLRPAAEENRSSRFTSANYSKCISPAKRERSPDAYDSRFKCSREEETEFEHFARGIVMQLKQLPLVHALEVQSEITNFLFQKRIQSLRQNHQTNTDVPVQYAFVYSDPEAVENRQEISTITIEKSSTEQEENSSVSC